MPNSVALSVATTPPSPLPHSRLARSHNRRFHIRFPGVDSEEHLLNYYSCALVADILLQGHLYITENYFAFYSNIFGRKTQILIPVCDVIKVTKERTAKIIPNAVGLYTEEGKYIFGSLLSRNTTYGLMHHVWLKSADPDSTEDEQSASDEPGSSDDAEPSPANPLPRSEELSVRRISRRKSDLFPRISAKAVRRQCTSSSSVVDQITLSKCHWDCAKGRDCFGRINTTASQETNSGLPKTTVVLLAATILSSKIAKLVSEFAITGSNLRESLVVMFLLATILVYRVSLVHNKNGGDESWTTKSGHRLASYLELLKQQQEAVEEEILRITTTLKNRVDELGQVRHSIDQMIGIAGRSSCSSMMEETQEPPADLSSLS